MKNKNEVVIITIEDLSSQGDGIGHIDGYTLFVKDTLIGDKVEAKIIKAKKSYGYARCIRLIKSSPDRVEPKCPIAMQCGGCQLQHLSYEKQLEYKQAKIKACFERIGKLQQVDCYMEPIVGMKEPYYYRNKAQFPVGYNKEGQLVTGFYAKRTHCIIDTSHCYIQAQINENLLIIIKQFLKQYEISIYEEATHTGLVRHILTRVGFTTNEIMVCLILNGDNLPYSEQLIKQLISIPGMTSISFNINMEKTNVILGEKIVTLWGKPYITDYIGSIRYQISPLSFYQINPIQTKKLYEIVLEYADLHGTEIVWDLYCGIGTISLFLAQKAKYVYGVEIIPQAIEDAKQNAAINKIENVEFYVGSAEEIVPQKYKEQAIYAEVIVIDPPRKGCEEVLLDTILEMHPKCIVYVSCDPATLARDVKYLNEKGYEVEKIRAVDQFAHTMHVECVVKLCRVEK